MPPRTPEFRKLVAEAIVHYQAGRFTEAEAAYRAALTVTPGHASVLHNLGVLAAGRGDHRGAIDCFDAAIASEPAYVSAHYNRAVAFEILGQRKQAIAGLSHAAALDPGHYESHRALALLLLAEGDRGRALDHFARTYELRRGDDRSGIAANSLESANRTKLYHDANQFHYLATRKRDGARFEAMARNYELLAMHFPTAVTKLSASDFDLLGESYNTAINLAEGPEVVDRALNDRPDRDDLVRQFREGAAGVVAFDELLAPRALAVLKQYLLESTIWHDFSHIAGFVASYLEDGLACPLVLQIVDELRQTFSGLLEPHPLSQAWAFKAVDPTAAVDVHADDGAISINFWLTASEASRNAAGGGLRVSRVPPPSDWKLTGYDADRQRAVTFLEQTPEDRVIVPYRENRAVLFESRLLHASDRPVFAEGYENHRINVTFVFGRGTGP